MELRRDLTLELRELTQRSYLLALATVSTLLSILISRGPVTCLSS